MVASKTSKFLTTAQREQWEEQGFVIIEAMFSAGEIDMLRSAFDEMAKLGEPTPFWQPEDNPDEPLKRYPRAVHPHRWLDYPVGPLSRDMMLKSEVRDVLQALLNEDVVACQSMFYFKPPGAKGQALHQDNFYLDVAPDTCYAAWTAIDAVEPENGGLYVVPGTHKLDLQCPDTANPQESFTTHLVNAPKGMKAVATHMQPGDTLFFNGNVIHGSGMNKSKSQWRRSFICHYMPRNSQFVSKHYFPIYDFDGRELTYEAAAAGGPCGMEWKPSSYNA